MASAGVGASTPTSRKASLPGSYWPQQKKFAQDTIMFQFLLRRLFLILFILFTISLLIFAVTE
ncbi:MAG: hypothetical protein KDE31_03005, partial [Caldilineaceae bacterium]|nr:hypothetical protein [Caldilineaceae bacterium]